MTGERVDVLRLGYRLGRDPRITTHLALVGRALGADRFLLAGDEDPKMFENLESVADRFGGGMETEHIHSPMGWLRRFVEEDAGCLLYTSPSPRDGLLSRMPSSA